MTRNVCLLQDLCLIKVACFLPPPHLPHGLNRIIVGHDAKNGANVTIFQGVTISQGGCVIGDNVLLGANCTILPNVHIGDNAKVGANCVVVENVPKGATCVMLKPIIKRKNENFIYNNSSQC